LCAKLKEAHPLAPLTFTFPIGLLDTHGLTATLTAPVPRAQSVGTLQVLKPWRQKSRCLACRIHHHTFLSRAGACTGGASARAPALAELPLSFAGHWRPRAWRSRGGPPRRACWAAGATRSATCTAWPAARATRRCARWPGSRGPWLSGRSAPSWARAAARRAASASTARAWTRPPRPRSQTPSWTCRPRKRRRPRAGTAPTGRPRPARAPARRRRRRRRRTAARRRRRRARSRCTPARRMAGRAWRTR